MICEEEFWREKSRINWHIHGDRNTEFFHKMAKIRSSTKQISVMKDGDIVLDKATDIENHILSYYMNLFASGNSCQSNSLVNEVIPTLVTTQDNDHKSPFYRRS